MSLPGEGSAGPWGGPESFWFRLRWRRRAGYADEIDIFEKGACPENQHGQVLGRLDRQVLMLGWLGRSVIVTVPSEQEEEQSNLGAQLLKQLVVAQA
jgi:hypothetical protein